MNNHGKGWDEKEKQKRLLKIEASVNSLFRCESSLFYRANDFTALCAVENRSVSVM